MRKLRVKITPILNPKYSSEEDGSENGAHHFKRKKKLEKHPEAIANRSNLQESGVIWSY